MTVHDFLDSLDPQDRGVDMRAVGDQLGAARADVQATITLLDNAGAGRQGDPLAVRVAALIAERDVAQGIARIAQGNVETYAILRDVAEHLRGQPAKLPPGPIGTGDAINALASTVRDSPSGMAYIIDRLPGLAHAIDRVTRFADPPVDVYHATGRAAGHPCRAVVCAVCRAKVMTLPDGTLPVHDRWTSVPAARSIGQCAGTGTRNYTLPTTPPE